MRLWVKILLGVALTLTVTLVFTGDYFYNYAVVPSEKNSLNGDTPGTTQTSKETDTHKWLSSKENQNDWTITSKDGLKLSAVYLPAETKSEKIALVTHGYMENAEAMANYAKMFHDMGYNILVPNARGHGRSEGDYIGSGRPECKDYIQWISKVLEDNGKSQEIVLYDVSMGAAIVMVTNGEKLPDNVKAIVEGCGHSSVHDELAYQLDDVFSLPAFPLMQVTNLVTEVRAGYFFGEANAVEQLEKNQRLMLSIHGDKDTFVPFEMSDRVYRAAKRPRERYVIKGAKYVEACKTDPEKYQRVVQ